MVRGMARWFVPFGLVALLIGPLTAASAAQSSTAKPKTSSQKTSTPAKAPAKPAARTSLARAAAAARASAPRSPGSRPTRRRRTSSATLRQPGAGRPRRGRHHLQPADRRVLWEENSHDQRSIASLTKIMTAVTFVADDPDLTQRVAVTRADMLHASTTYLRRASPDARRPAAPDAHRVGQRGRARARAHVGRRHGGVRRPHERDGGPPRPDQHALRRSVRPRPEQHVVGLRPLAPHRVRLVGRAARRRSCAPPSTRCTRASGRFRSTARTSCSARTSTCAAARPGFISKAGYCLATLLQVPQGSQVAVVVLGAANSTTRFWEARHLFNWVVGRTPGHRRRRSRARSRPTSKRQVARSGFERQ